MHVCVNVRVTVRVCVRERVRVSKRSQREKCVVCERVHGAKSDRKRKRDVSTILCVLSVEGPCVSGLHVKMTER